VLILPRFTDSKAV